MSTPREAPALHNLAVGVVILRESPVPAVYEKDRWGLPKGDSEPDEFFFETVVREAAEETNVEVEIRSFASTNETRAPDRHIYLQRFYHAMPAADDPTPSPSDPDDEIEAAKFLPLTAFGSALVYRPRVELFRNQLRDRKPRHYTYDLTREPSDMKKWPTTRFDRWRSHFFA